MIKVGVTRGGQGWSAVKYDTESGEPIDQGFGRYATRREAELEAHTWANDEELECECLECKGPPPKPEVEFIVKKMIINGVEKRFEEIRRIHSFKN